MIEMNMDCATFLGHISGFFGDSLADVHRYYDERPYFERWGGGTVEPAVGQLLYIITRLFRPTYTIELGTNVGYSTACIASALIDNHWGLLDTFEIDLEHKKEAKQRLIDLALDLPVYFHHGSSLIALEPFLEENHMSVDMAFIDSSHDYEDTKKEIQIIDKYLKSGGVILFHDALAVDSGVTRALDEIAEHGIWDMMRLPTQPNTGFGIIRKN